MPAKKSAKKPPSQPTMFQLGSRASLSSHNAVRQRKLLREDKKELSTRWLTSGTPRADYLQKRIAEGTTSVKQYDKEAMDARDRYKKAAKTRGITKKKGK